MTRAEAEAYIRSCGEDEGPDDAAHAIDESKRRDSIVTIAWSDVAERDLLAQCEDTADRGEVIEFWGVDDNVTWRVHLERTHL